MADTYTQESGDAVDFSLADDETYTQVSGSTVDFDLSSVVIADTTSFTYTVQTATDTSSTTDTGVTQNLSFTTQTTSETTTTSETATTTSKTFNVQTTLETRKATDAAVSTSFVFKDITSTDTGGEIELAEATSVSFTPTATTEAITTSATTKRLVSDFEDGTVQGWNYSYDDYDWPYLISTDTISGSYSIESTTKSDTEFPYQTYYTKKPVESGTDIYFKIRINQDTGGNDRATWEVWQDDEAYLYIYFRHGTNDIDWRSGTYATNYESTIASDYWSAGETVNVRIKFLYSEQKAEIFLDGVSYGKYNLPDDAIEGEYFFDSFNEFKLENYTGATDTPDVTVNVDDVYIDEPVYRFSSQTSSETYIARDTLTAASYTFTEQTTTEIVANTETTLLQNFSFTGQTTSELLTRTDPSSAADYTFTGQTTSETLVETVTETVYTFQEQTVSEKLSVEASPTDFTKSPEPTVEAKTASTTVKTALFEYTAVETTETITDYDYGVDGELRIYADRQQVNSFPHELTIEKRLNEMDTFNLRVYGDDQDRSIISEDKEVMVFDGDESLVFKGEFTDVEYKSDFEIVAEGRGMEEKLLNRKTNRVEYVSTAADSIVSDLVDNVSVDNNEAAPKATLRFDHDSKLKAVAEVANSVGYDWYMSQKPGDDFDTDYFNFVQRQGSSTSVKTLDIGGDATLIENNTDAGHIANDITLLGRGDGVNQLEARVHAASKARTTTTGEIAQGSTGTFNVESTSDFGSTGDNVKIRVGSEVIDADINDSSSFSINTRGINDAEGNTTEDIAHREDVQVWLQENVTTGDGPYTPTDSGAETGSSIDDNGVVEIKELDKKVIEKPALEKIADNKLKNRRQPVKRIKVKASEPRTDVSMGDTVTVDDEFAMSLNDEYRVVGIDRKWGIRGERTILHCANRPLRLTERLEDMERNITGESAHMQGATNMIQLTEEDNADSSSLDSEFPLEMKFFLPEDAVQINKAEVAMHRVGFRGYVQNSDHKHDVDVTHPEHEHNITTTADSSDTGEHLTRSILHYRDGYTADTASAALVQAAEVPSSPTGTFEGATVTVEIKNSTGSSETYDWALKNSTDGTTLYSDTTTISDGAGISRQISLSPTAVSAGDVLDLEISDGTIGTESGNNTLGRTGLIINSQSSHDHSMTSTSSKELGTTSTETSLGSGKPTYGLFTPTTEPDVDVDIDVDDGTGYTNAATKTGVSVGQDFTPIDISGEIDESGRWYTVRLDPSDRCRLGATLLVKYFVESKV